MSVTHDFECACHGVFTKRVRSGLIPRCPRGCSADFVTLVHLTAPSIGTDRVRVATQLVREMADLQHLADIDTSPSRPGNSVGERNFMRSGNPLQARAVNASEYMNALSYRSNELTRLGMGHPYDPREWKENKETGKMRHAGAQPPVNAIPMNQYGVSVQRVKEKQ